MSQVNEYEWQSDSSLKAADANAAHAEAAREFAAAPQIGLAPVDVNDDVKRSFPIGPRNFGAVGPGKFHPSPSLSPQLVDSLDGVEEFGEDLGPVKNCLANAYNGLNAINAAVVKLRQDSTVTPDAAVVKVVAQAERKTQQIFDTFGKTAERLHKTIETLEAGLLTPVEQRAGLGTINDNIRAHAKGLEITKRSVFVEEAFKAKDETTLTALCGAPHYLSGLTKEAHAFYLRRLHEMREPDTTRRLASLRAAAALVERAFPIAIAGVETALGSSFKRAKELKAGADASDLAIAAIMTVPGE